VTAYIIRRLLLGILVLFGISVLTFGLMRLLPGDPLMLFVGMGEYESFSPERQEILRHEYGLDQPVVAQYFNWLGGMFRGDFGDSIALQRSVGRLIAQRLPITLNLGFFTLLLCGFSGITLGTICALRRGKWLDSTLSAFANAGITIPSFALGIFMIYVFAIKLHWLPTYGYTSPFRDLGDNLRKLIMPVLCLSLFGTAALTRQTRSSMLEVIQQDYIRTAWSKGLRERTVVVRHVIKNGLIPVITTLGMQVSYIFGGAVVIEVVFSIPGMGRLIIDGVMNKDYMVVQGAVMIVGVIVVLVNLLVDIAYGWVDPRIHYK
jgi:peptide/nickel transport system permease protein